MKVLITGFGFFMIFVLTVAIVMSLGIENRESEKLTDSVELAIYQSLEEGIEKQEDPGTIFSVNLEPLLEGEAYEITIVESDIEKGILSVLVKLSYKNMGRERNIQVQRTVIYER